MILTGKAKEDFEFWDNDIHGLICIEPRNVEVLFNDLNPNLQYAIIIEWLDSIGIYINVSPSYIDHEIKYSLGYFKAVINFKEGINTCNVDFYFESCLTQLTRDEATKQAIIKANEIYNSNNK